MSPRTAFLSGLIGLYTILVSLSMIVLTALAIYASRQIGNPEVRAEQRVVHEG